MSYYHINFLACCTYNSKSVYINFHSVVSSVIRPLFFIHAMVYFDLIYCTAIDVYLIIVSELKVLKDAEEEAGQLELEDTQLQEGNEELQREMVMREEDLRKQLDDAVKERDRLASSCSDQIKAYDFEPFYGAFS